jgi:two-component system NarL family response regulator
MSPAIAKRLLDRFLAAPPEEERERLSVREESIVRLLADGLIYKEVAEKLNISPHTVHGHIKKIYGKLQVSDRGEALEKARRLGYLEGK